MVGVKLNIGGAQPVTRLRPKTVVGVKRDAWVSNARRPSGRLCSPPSTSVILSRERLLALLEQGPGLAKFITPEVVS